MTRSSRVGLVVIALRLVLSPGAAGAGRPLDTEDTGTVEPGKVELELGADYTRNPEDRTGALTGVLSVGVLPGLEGRAESALIRLDQDGQGARGGLGDSLLGVKYRVLDETEARPAVLTALAVRFPTGDDRRGLGARGEDVQLLLVVSKGFGPVTLTGNAGYTVVTTDREADTWTLAGAAEYRLAKAWTLVGEVVGALGARQAADTAVVRIGAVYALTEGIRVDAAVGTGLGRDSPDLSLRVGVTIAF